MFLQRIIVKLLLILLVQICVSGKLLYEECRSHMGKEFVLIFTDNSRHNNLLRLYITTPVNESFTVHVETPLLGQINQDYVVTNGSELFIELPIDLAILRTTKSNKTILVTAQNFIVLFASNMQSNGGDSYIIYPIAVLSTEHVSVNLKTKSGSYHSVTAVIAIADQTVVDISLPAGAVVVFDGTKYTSGNTLSMSLNKYEVFQFTSSDDLSGTILTSNYPIAAFSGHELGNPEISSQTSIDMIYEMLIPTIYWSTYYIAISNPVFDSGEGELIQVFTSEDNTNIMINTSGTLDQISVGTKASYHQFDLPLSEVAVITADKPVLVSQISASKQLAGSYTGDARLLLPSPVNAWLSEYSFNTPGENMYNGLVLLADSISLNNITLNEKSLNSSIQWTEIKGTNFIYTSIQLSEGVHTLTCISTASKCWGYVYGIHSLEEYGTSIGRSFTQKTEDNLNFNQIKSSVLEFKNNGMIYTTPIFSTVSRSLVGCIKMCRIYLCAIVSFRSADGSCLLYTDEEKCGSIKLSTGFKLYFVRN
ncbi:uncharacterized protein LOC134722971 [Mytilus trossulus]|uniref:uncharacterized protein LOC134722971 n=1 Tax=Mytilus trossulus TaxID=6551 RepID=UPI003006FA29